MVTIRTSDWWRTTNPAECWVCGHLTNWVYLDQAHQHPDCDQYPTEDGGHVRIVRGVRSDIPA